MKGRGESEEEEWQRKGEGKCIGRDGEKKQGK